MSILQSCRYKWPPDQTSALTIFRHHALIAAASGAFYEKLDGQIAFADQLVDVFFEGRPIQAIVSVRSTHEEGPGVAKHLTNPQHPLEVCKCCQVKTPSRQIF